MDVQCGYLDRRPGRVTAAGCCRTTAICGFPCLSQVLTLACSTCPLLFHFEALSAIPLYKISISTHNQPTHHYFPALLRCGIGVFVDSTAALTRPAHASESSPSAPFCGHLEPRPDNILLDLIHSSPPQRVLSRIHPAQVSDTFFALSPPQLASP